ncbi:hypothetical protein V8E36_002134 [Tilletia maclaganii]
MRSMRKWSLYDTRDFAHGVRRRVAHKRSLSLLRSLLASKMLSADDIILPMRTTGISGPELSDVDTAGANERRLAYWKRIRALIYLSSSPSQEPERARTSRRGAAALAALCQTLPGRAAFSSSAPPVLARPLSLTLYLGQPKTAHMEEDIRIKPLNVELEEDGMCIGLTIVDTPGRASGTPQV